jgi:hypothetical protein
LVEYNQNEIIIIIIIILGTGIAQPV